MSAHTPGPWAVCVHAQNHYWVAGQTIGAESPSDARRVCDVTDWASPMGLANARLIAAAPDLLDIVRRLTLLTDEGDDRMHGVYTRHDAPGVVRAKGSTLALIEDARAAINKATEAA